MYAASTAIMGIAMGMGGSTVAWAAAPVTLVPTASVSKELLERTPLTQTFYTKTALALCDAVIPVPARYNNHSYDANAAIRRCRADIGRSNPELDVTKKDLYEMTVRICSGHAMESDARKYTCYSKAQSLMPHADGMRELKICGLAKRFDQNGREIIPSHAKKSKTVACVEDQMQCIAAFPTMKQGLRERLTTVAKLMKNLKISHANAQERWGVLATSEVTAGNVEAARSCLLKTMNAYSQLRHPSARAASVRDSVQLVLEELRMTFPETSEAPRSENQVDTVR
jgi:hypothetical protein